MVENIFKERARRDGRRCALERREIHELVQSEVSELDQDFHNQNEIQVGLVALSWLFGGLFRG